MTHPLLPNEINVNKLINRIALEPAEKLYMGKDYGTAHCGSPQCVIGWAGTIMMEEEGITDEHACASQRQIEYWLNINTPTFHQIYFAQDPYGRRSRAYLACDEPEQVKTLVLHMLDILKETGECDWEAAGKRAGVI